MLVDITQTSQYPDGWLGLTAPKLAVMNVPTGLEGNYYFVHTFPSSALHRKFDEMASNANWMS